MELFWYKPVLVLYKEKIRKPEREPFAVIKAKKLAVSKDEKGKQLRGSIEDFIPLMGDIKYISSHTGPYNRYVICWMDDRVDDFGKAWRRLSGATFATPPSVKEGRLRKYGGKKLTFNAYFEAEKGKLD